MLRKSARSLAAISVFSGAVLGRSTTRMEGDPFNCADPVCKSKIDLFRSAMNKKKDEPAVPEITVANGGDCPVDKDELGRGTWALLHTMAAYFPERPTSQQKVYAELLYRGLAALYPCKICAEHMRECIKEKPPDVDSREALSLWVCGLHNKVNDVLGKDAYPCNLKELDVRWRTGSKSCWGDEGEQDDASNQEKL